MAIRANCRATRPFLAGVERTLGVENPQIAVHAFEVTGPGKAVGLGQGLDQGFLSRNLPAHGVPFGKGVGHLAEGGLNGLFILGHRDLTIHLGHPVGRPGTGIENGNTDLGCKAPGTGTVLEKTGELGACRTDGGGQGDSGKKAARAAPMLA